MPSVIVIGGGLAGLSASAALGSAGWKVDLFESRGFFGGRATSYPLHSGDGAEGESQEIIDNCQHILLRCCVNLMDFYTRLGVEHKIEFHRDFYFVEPGGRISTLSAGIFPKPFHFTESFFKLTYLNWADKISVGRGLLAIQRQRKTRTDLDRISMLDWLKEQNQTPRAIERFWNQVLVSAINEDAGRMAASHGFQVFWLGFLAHGDTYEMGIPSIPLGELYGPDRWGHMGDVEIHPRSGVDRVRFEEGRVAGIEVAGELRTADHYLSAVPFERVPGLMPELEMDISPFEHSPITGIHMWLDRPITALPHATLLDRTIQWMFNKGEGKYIQLVVSASRKLTAMPRANVIALALRELAEFFPAAEHAVIERAHVVKEVRATFSARPGLEALRPGPVTKFPNLFLAGDWTRSGWPATMEGAVRSGYIAAEAVAAAAGSPEKFLLPEVA